MKAYINGIQQVGIGVKNIEEAFTWYRRMFGTDVIIFRDTAVASLMTRYTGGKPERRHAILAMNMQGGGGLEIWQFADRAPCSRPLPPQIGDLGILAVKIKTVNIEKAFAFHHSAGVGMSPQILHDPSGVSSYFLKDPYGNLFQVVSTENRFAKTNHVTGAVAGAIIGVSDLDKSIAFYSQVLGYEKTLHQGEDAYEDLSFLPGGEGKLRRAILSRHCGGSGAFGKLLGPSVIELIESPGETGKRIYQDRFWGDPGFIHICFDLHGMPGHEAACKAKGFDLTVNSCKSFDMGDAAGHFAYNEDPDGTLIEYVETHRVPVAKKLNLYINLRNRNPEKPLPDWMVRCLAFGRVKE